MNLRPDQQSLSLGNRVIVINVARIGDTLLGTPLLRSIKHHLPACHLTCVAHPKRGEVLEHLDFIDQLLFFTKKTSFWRFRGRKRWDTGFVLGSDPALLKFALRTCHRVIAFHQGIDPIDSRLFQAVQKPHAPIHAIHERLLLANAMDIQPDTLSLAYAVTDAEHKIATKWLQENTPHGARPIIGLQMSSFPTKAYRDWPVEQFVALAQGILSVFPHAFFILLGGSDAHGRAHQFSSQLPHHSTVEACGKLSLRLSAAIMRTLDLYVGVDTGPTHLAGALGIPMVALYHCVHPGKLLAPLVSTAGVSVIEQPLSEGPCQRTTPMSQITVEVVLSAALERLAPTKNKLRG